MPKKTITQLQYPANMPSANGFYYMCWMSNLGFEFTDFRAWDAGAWQLNPNDEVISFIENGRKAI
jgi:hypothetical protein